VAAFKLPEKLLLLPELPRNPLGKVLKRQLRDRLPAAAEGAPA
jgi:non-ribosomal peptide synthetase component E (peptide arylation enzyme)